MDTSKTGLEMFFKPYQVHALDHLDITPPPEKTLSWRKSPVLGKGVDLLNRRGIGLVYYPFIVTIFDL